MRILIVAPVPPQRSGAGAIPILLEAQVAGLRERNELTLVSAVGDDPGEAEAAERLRASGLDVHFADRRQPPPGRRRWRRRARMASEWAFGRRPWRAIWFADPGVQAILDRLAAERSFDVAVVEDSAMSGYRLPAGVPALLTEHEVLRPRPPEWGPGADPRQWPARAFAELDWRKRPPFQRTAWREFDRVLAFGRRDAAAIAELAPEVAERVRVSPFGLELPPAADPDGVEPDTLLFVGNFSHQPNRDAARWLAAEIMPALLAQRPAARLRIVGSAAAAEILALAGPAIEVIADAPSVEPLLAAAAVVVAPVRTGGGMRMKVLEAMAAGKAVVTTSRGGEGFDCFEQPPPLALADDATGFATAVAGLLGGSERRRRVSEAARRFAESHYSPGAWAKRLEEAYGEVIGSHG
ncbi:MAG TPA: glycosyltransferase family 4 protein [Solirubrobacterales bacterium]|nr:glycosyltransferase family 4 protein [Solirubrobacterales bacterium]